MSCASDDPEVGDDIDADDTAAHGSAGSSTEGGGGSTGLDNGGGSDSSTGGTGTGEPPAAVDPDPSPGCGTSLLQPGTQSNLTLMFDGVERTYDLLVPDNYDGDTPLPLVFNFHGFGSNPTEQAFFSQMNTTAASRGFAVVYPAGLDDSWNGGACCGNSMADGVDDVGFTRALAAALQDELCVDRRRIFATGMSNGGFLSHRLGCEAADLFAAVAPVAAVLGIAPEDCSPSRVMPIHHTHGTMDQLVPYEGGGLADSLSVRESIEGWVQRNGCDPEPTVTFDTEPVVCETWSDCGEQGHVVLCTAQDVGHCWPGNDFCPFGMSTTVMHASEAMADFFEAHPMPQ